MFFASPQRFAETAESIFKNAERRNDLDKSYRTLVGVVFKNIERAAKENQKTPADVILFGKRSTMSLTMCQDTQ